MKKKSKILLSIILSLVLVVTMSGNSMMVFATGETSQEAETSTTTKENDEAAAKKAADEEARKAEEDKKKAEIESKNQQLEKKIDAINQDLEALKEKQAEIKSKLTEAKKKVSEKQAVVNYIDGQISTTKSEIGLLENKISLLEQEIEQKEADIEVKVKEYEANYQMFLDRVRAMYMYDSSNTLGLLLGTDSYVDFLTTSDNLTRIAEHDEKLMDALNEERKALEEEKKSLEANQEDLSESAQEAKAKKDELAQKQKIAEDQVYEVASLQQQFEKDLAASVAQSKKMQAEINSIYAQIELSKSAYVGGAMAWPVPGYTMVTSSFGWRFGGSDFHTGIDISGGGVHGKPVVAANDGKVVFVNWAYSAGSGYGIYVMVDHGGGMTTLYAHLSNITVSVGQQVTRGQTIGAVGSTGWSTGPHLHFEVRENKTAKDPYPYIT